MKHLPRRRLVVLGIALVVLAAAVVVLVTVVSNQSSAKTPLNGAFSHVVVTAAGGSGPIYPWEQVRVTADWKVPDHSPAGTTFSLAWPVAQLKGVGGDLTLKNATDDVVETCTLRASSLDCVLTSFVTTHPYDIQGSLWFTLTQETIPENSTVTIPFTSGSLTLDATYTTAGSAANAFTGITYSTDVYVHDGKVTWYVYLPGGKTGQATDYTNVLVEEALGGDQTHQQSFQSGTFSLEHGTKLNSDGTFPIWETASPRLYTVTITGTPSTFRFAAPKLAAGGWWRLVFDVTVTPADYKGTVSDTATTTWAGQSPLTNTHSEVYVDAGGTGSGQAH